MHVMFYILKILQLDYIIITKQVEVVHSLVQQNVKGYLGILVIKSISYSLTYSFFQTVYHNIPPLYQILKDNSSYIQNKVNFKPPYMT